MSFFSENRGYIIAVMIVILLLLPVFPNDWKDTYYDYDDTKANINTNKHTTEIQEVDTVMLVSDTYPLPLDGVIPVLSARRDASI
jgi:hypothetical protein